MLEMLIVKDLEKVESGENISKLKWKENGHKEKIIHASHSCHIYTAFLHAYLHKHNRFEVHTFLNKRYQYLHYESEAIAFLSV